MGPQTDELLCWSLNNLFVLCFFWPWETSRALTPIGPFLPRSAGLEDAIMSETFELKSQLDTARTRAEGIPMPPKKGRGGMGMP